MPHSFSDRAIVLRAWSVGETDRFCILLTEGHGRISVRVPGARRETSRRGRGLLPFHVVDITWSQRSDVHFVTAASCITPNADAWTDPRALETAQQGTMLVLRHTEEGVSLPDVFALTEDFLSVCDDQSSSVLDLFAIKLLRLLGSFPSASHSLLTNQRFSAHDSVVWSSEHGGFVTVEDDPFGLSVDPVTHRILSAVDTLPLCDSKNFSPAVSALLRRIVQGLVPIQLGASVPIVSVASPRILASSSAVTPI